MVIYNGYFAFENLTTLKDQHLVPKLLTRYFLHDHQLSVEVFHQIKKV